MRVGGGSWNLGCVEGGGLLFSRIIGCVDIVVVSVLCFVSFFLIFITFLLVS